VFDMAAIGKLLALVNEYGPKIDAKADSIIDAINRNTSAMDRLSTALERANDKGNSRT